MNDTERDKLVHVLWDQVPEDWDENDIGILADAILVEFLPEHDKQVRAAARSEAYRGWFCQDALVSRGYWMVPCRDCNATGIFALPDGTDECVACKGQGYVPLSMTDPYRRAS